MFATTPSHHMYEQRQELIDGYGPPHDFAGRVKSTGNRLTETLEKLDCGQAQLSMLANIAAMISAFMALLQSTWAISLIGIVESFFLLAVATVFVGVDWPGSPEWSRQIRTIVRRQAKFATKLTGRGLLYINMGCLAMLIVWSVRRGLIGLLLGLTLALITFFTGVVVLIQGLSKSITLNDVRSQLVSRSRGAEQNVYKKYAMRDAAFGLTLDEFRVMLVELSQGTYNPTDNDLALIFSSLDDASKGGISDTEFTHWVNGGMLYL